MQWGSSLFSSLWWGLLTALWAKKLVKAPANHPPTADCIYGAVLSSLSVVPLSTAGLPFAALLAAASGTVAALLALKTLPKNTGSEQTRTSAQQDAKSSENETTRSSPRRGRVVLLLLQTLLSWQAIAEHQERQVEPPGRLLSIGGGRSLHLHCVGYGDKTAVLEAGLPFSSLAWEPVLRLHKTRLESNTSQPFRVCAYDRAGYGWSLPVQQSRSGPDLVDDLDRLLSAAKIERPILVGWSYGGHIVSAYACQKPANVSGLVLVDATAPDLYFCLPGFKSNWKYGLFMFHLAEALQPLGFFRLLWGCGWGPLPVQAGGPPPGLPADINARVAAQCGAWSFPSTAKAELLGMRKGDQMIASCFSNEDLVNGKAPLGDMPIVSLRAADHVEATVGGLGFLLPRFPAENMSSDSRVVQAGRGSDHFFLVRLPALILEAISRSYLIAAA